MLHKNSVPSRRIISFRAIGVVFITVLCAIQALVLSINWANQWGVGEHRSRTCCSNCVQLISTLISSLEYRVATIRGRKREEIKGSGKLKHMETSTSHFLDPVSECYLELTAL